MCRVQKVLAKGSWPTQFNVDKLTVFEVIVKDANITDLEQACSELRTNLAQLGKDQEDIFKRLISSWINENIVFVISNSARTPHELRKNSARTFMKHFLNPVIAMNFVEPIYPDNPHHPQ